MAVQVHIASNNVFVCQGLVFGTYVLLVMISNYDGFTKRSCCEVCWLRSKLVLCKKLSKCVIREKLLVRVEIYAYRVKLDRRRIRKFIGAEVFTRM